MRRHTLTFGALAFLYTATLVYAQTSNQAEQLAAAEAKWVALDATNYQYKLTVGGVFGAGVYMVKVRNGRCRVDRRAILTIYGA